MLLRSPEYSDREILKLLLAGQGPIAKENPDLLSYLGFDPERPMTDPDVLNKLVNRFLAYYPDSDFADFRERVTSGNPRSVEAALKDLTSTWQRFATEELELKQTPSVQGPCDGGAWLCTTAFVAAVANGAIYVNGAAATNVLVAAAAVFVVGPVAYFDDKNERYGGMTNLEKDVLTVRISRSLAS